MNRPFVTITGRLAGRDRTILTGWLLLAACLLLLTSCVPAPPPTLPLLDEQALLQRLQANAGAFQSLRGMARIRTENSSGSASARQVLLLAKPGRIRAEVLGPFGQPLLLLAARDGRMSVHLPREQRFLQGPATADRIASFTRLPLAFDELVRLALYDVPLISYSNSEMAHSGKGYRLSLYDDASLQQQLDFDGAGRLLGTGYYRAGQLALEVSYQGFDGERGGFPSQVTVAMPERQASFSVSYGDIELNPALAAERFSLAPPAGTVVEALP